MAIDLAFRKRAVSTLTNAVGVYLLCDLDNVPIYVGQSSKEGIKKRVSRHLTSARSDIIANRQLDVWEIAWVRAFPISDPAGIDQLETALFYHFDKTNPLMNGKLPAKLKNAMTLPEPAQIVQVMSEAEIAEKLDPALRLPRQAEHYSQIVGHFLAVKNSDEIARAMDSHFKRLAKYHRTMLAQAEDVDEGDDG